MYIERHVSHLLLQSNSHMTVLSTSPDLLHTKIIYMIGWSPDVSQPKACRRGSAANSMKDIGKK